MIIVKVSTSRSGMMSNGQELKPRKEQIKEFAIAHLNETFKTDDIKKELNEKYGTPFNSVIPTDYCYNCTNAGINFDLNTRFFEKIEGGFFRVLGANYPYTGKVYSKKVLFGEWNNGNFTKIDNFTNVDMDELLKQYQQFKNSETHGNEQYKWDFAQKYYKKLENCENVIEELSQISAYNFQSYFMRNSGIRFLVQMHPETVIESFKELFNSSNDIESRIHNFRTIIQSVLNEDEEWKNKSLTDPGVETASFYLFANDYKEFLLFTKMNPYNKFAKRFKLGIEYETPEQRYSAWQNYCNNVLVPTMNQVLNTENSLLDAQDFIWFITNYENIDYEESVETKKYWMLSAGKNGDKWADFKDNSIIAIGWNDLGDLKQYHTREDIKTALQQTYNEINPKNNSLTNWQFANEMNIGDIVFVKSSRIEILARGEITSDYIFDESRSDYKSIRKVNWTNIKTINCDSKWAIKTLTDITPYTEDVKRLEDEFDVEIEEEIEDNFDKYTKEDFLSEVFMDDNEYETLKNLLLYKKNIILQGAPGVGKTFAARRLAYSILGVKDTNKVKMVQFHQNYGYEDFIMGYRPTSAHYELKYGPFYDFCKQAEEDADNKYFFIIDEINRGKLSKIFGELLMLIETDKRGLSLQLLYRDEQFSVPKNVYIIGMMNTADRSLAMMDYALRRRFSFYEFKPAFSTESFKKYQLEKGNEKFSSLIQEIIRLNKEILEDPCLGEGFRIGHSYFCTSKDTIDDEWLNSVVNYEIIPLLKEYWFDDPEKANTWIRNLKAIIK